MTEHTKKMGLFKLDEKKNSHAAIYLTIWTQCPDTHMFLL